MENKHFKTTNLKISPDLLKRISEIDEFKGAWRALGTLSPERLSALKRVATIESIGSSTRIEGSKLSDREIEQLLSKLEVKSFETRDEQEVAGYAETMETVFEAWLVSSTGDVFPSFTAAPSVDLTGQRIFIGSTVGTVGTTGSLNISGGGVLTAAQIVPGTGGLGIGTVTVTGAGSQTNLTGAGPYNGLDIGSWGTGTLSVLNGASILCSSPLACPFNDIGNAAGSSGTVSINGGSVSGLGSLNVGTGNLVTGFGTPGANTSATLTINNGGRLSTSGFNERLGARAARPALHADVPRAPRPGAAPARRCPRVR